ncbi:acyltransferase family protein [Mesorhizobium australicum]|uniref:acyltransferase family protein n=1 Tax=Mesorhizobium australicum TaxID=536018 RepID=UPI003334EF42
MAMMGSQHKIRTEIEGLRAVAVLSVILFHLGVTWLPGGFLGVDVFFVISGFLITTNILRDLERDRFSFKEFYLRRFLRLFPALATTALATLVASFILLPPDEVMDLARSAVAAIFSVSNIYFWSKVGYFDTAAHLKPLLHTWSLGVEERFYLIWPATLVATLRLFGPRTALWVVGCAGIASMVAALVTVGSSPSTAFYLMPFRMFEFALGIVVALPWRRPKLGAPLTNIVGGSGLLAVLGGGLPPAGYCTNAVILVAGAMRRYGRCNLCRKRSSYIPSAVEQVDGLRWPDILQPLPRALANRGLLAAGHVA